MIELVISIKLFVQMDIITLALILYVNSEELELFKSILNYLENGNLYTSDRKSACFVILEINNINILMNRIIPIFSKGMMTKKSLDFED